MCSDWHAHTIAGYINCTTPMEKNLLASYKVKNVPPYDSAIPFSVFNSRK